MLNKIKLFFLEQLFLFPICNRFKQSQGLFEFIDVFGKHFLIKKPIHVMNRLD